jgi:hypothetical protein
MIYNSDFFYYGEDKKNFSISDDDIEKIKKLKSHRSNDSGYYDVMLQWRLEDNKEIVSSKEELSRLFVAMQFISMTADIINNNITKIDIKDYHISLLRRLYLEFEDYDDVYITMGFKRPFGNSNVLGDISDEIGKSKIRKDNLCSGRDDYDTSEESNVLLEFIDFLEEFYQVGFYLKYKSFISEGASMHNRFNNTKHLKDNWGFIDRPHGYLSSWKINPSEIRNEKLEKILN